MSKTYDHQKLVTAVSLYQNGNLNEASKIFHQLAKRNPNDFYAIHYLGVLEAGVGNIERAKTFMARSMSIRPPNIQFIENYATILFQSEDYNSAVVECQKGLQISPANVSLLYVSAISLAKLGKLTESITQFDKLLLLQPNQIVALNERGSVLAQLEQYDAALASIDKALELNIRYAEALLNRGNIFYKLKRYEESIAAYDNALMLKPDLAEAWLGLGNLYNELKLYDKALVAYEKALTFKADLVEAWYGCGFAFKELKHIEKAISSLEKSIALKSDFADAYWLRSDCFLLLGKYEQGWRDYEWRKKSRQPAGYLNFSQPLWLGADDIAGKTVLVHAEQGLGDTIQFCRYTKLMEGAGARVLFAPQNSLRALMTSLSPTIELVSIDDASLAFDYHCPLLSLPLAFRTISESIPRNVPYLRAETDRVERWQNKIGEGGFKIGICWQGKIVRIDSGRSFPVTEFSTISQIPNVRLISLHRGEGISQLTNLPDGMAVETLGDEFDAGSQAFLDTAAAMKNCDLIITSDTAVAHLAGALGVPVWVALKFVPDWRWMLDRSDTPWYPTMRLFRQTACDDWKNVFAGVEKELRLLLEIRP